MTLYDKEDSLMFEDDLNPIMLIWGLAVAALIFTTLIPLVAFFAVWGWLFRGKRK